MEELSCREKQGTRAGARRHDYRKTPKCPSCHQAGLEYNREINRKHRRRKGMKPRTIPVCGTDAGYAKHVRERTPKCQPCTIAHREYTRSLRQKKTPKEREDKNKYRRQGVKEVMAKMLKASEKLGRPLAAFDPKAFPLGLRFCACTGLTEEDGIKLFQDHIIPLRMGGSHTSENLQWLSESCNSSKKATLCCHIHNKYLGD